MNYLVGNTGFVGSNFAHQYKFDGNFNSSNIEDAFYQKPDLLVYAGVRAQKFIANKYPGQDFKDIQNAINNIKKIEPKRLVLISTIDVYPKPFDVNEDTFINEQNIEPYGKNRLYLETWALNNLNNVSIIRLPALFGKGLKKNFIFDLINLIPSLLNADKYNELKNNSAIGNSYKLQDNGFYKLECNDPSILKEIRKEFIEVGFTSLNFTDSRSIFDFYNLDNIWSNTKVVLDNNLKVVNLAVTPVRVSEIYKKITGKSFNNEISKKPPVYDFKTKYADLFNGSNGYIYKKEQVMNDLITFIKEHKQW